MLVIRRQHNWLFDPDQRGTVTLGSAIVLPVMLFLFIGVIEVVLTFYGLSIANETMSAKSREMAAKLSEMSTCGEAQAYIDSTPTNFEAAVSGSYTLVSASTSFSPGIGSSVELVIQFQVRPRALSWSNKTFSLEAFAPVENTMLSGCM